MSRYRTYMSDYARGSTKSGVTKPTKYKNKKVVVDGISFDSQKEAKRWRELKLLERAGEILNLERQVVYPFDKLTYKSGRIPYYVADFVYNEAEDFVAGKLVVEDVKSPITRNLPAYKLKWALMKHFYNIEIMEI